MRSARARGLGRGHVVAMLAVGAVFVGGNGVHSPASPQVVADTTDVVPVAAARPAAPLVPVAAAAPARPAAAPVAVPDRMPDERAVVAMRTALDQLGLPYVWGGDGPTNGDAGFDCSGLTHYSYGVAGVGLPRTAHTQFYSGRHVPTDDALKPGDLVFYGTPAFVHHVGLYLGEGRMVNAPTFGRPVMVAYYRWGGDDYLGATRPAYGGTPAGELPLIPAPRIPTTPIPFDPPAAPVPTAVADPRAPQPAEPESRKQALAEQGVAAADDQPGPAANDGSRPPGVEQPASEDPAPPVTPGGTEVPPAPDVPAAPPASEVPATPPVGGGPAVPPPSQVPAVPPASEVPVEPPTSSVPPVEPAPPPVAVQAPAPVPITVAPPKPKPVPKPKPIVPPATPPAPAPVAAPVKVKPTPTPTPSPAAAEEPEETG